VRLVVLLRHFGKMKNIYLILPDNLKANYFVIDDRIYTSTYLRYIFSVELIVAICLKMPIFRGNHYTSQSDAAGFCFAEIRSLT
jgi:hypothetical protein